MVLDKRKGIICFILVVVFLIISILMVLSINLFSVTKKSLNVEPKALIDMVDKSLSTEFLPSSEKLKILNYLVEYENLKANLKKLSLSELNRFTFLGDYLSQYFTKEELGISKGLLDDLLMKFDDASRNVDNKGILNVSKGISDKSRILSSVKNIRENIAELYNDNKISEKAYEKILDKLDNVEYNIDLSSLNSKDIQIDLSNVSNILNMEKNSYVDGADLSAFLDVDNELLDVQGYVDSINYVSNLLNNNIDFQNSDSVSFNDNSQRVANVINNIDIDSYSNLLEFVGEDTSVKNPAPINFSNTISLPKIKVEGSIENPVDINFDTLSIDFLNMLGTVDTALIPNDFFQNKLTSMTDIEVPNVSLDDLIHPKETKNPTKTENPTEIENPTKTDKPQETENPQKTDKPQEKDNHEEIQDPKKTLSPKETKGPKETVKSRKINLKAIAIVIGLGLLVGIVFIIINKNKGKELLREYYKRNEEFNINENMPNNYKQRLIKEGCYILDIIKEKCLKSSKTLTPRETMYEFMRASAFCDDEECYKFLRYFEETTFYKLKVDENIYSEFSNICRNILTFAKIKGENI